MQLTQGETLLLSGSSDVLPWMRLQIDHGIGRLGASFGETWPDITLAFCGGSEPEWLHVPHGGFYQLEALTPMQLQLDRLPASDPGAALRLSPVALGGRDLLAEWLLDLHLIRHPVGADARLAALLRLLVARFGVRTAEGYQLPFSLGHARLAELINATRSTVTRQLVLLRQKGQIRQDDPAGTLVLMPSFMEGSAAPRPR